MIPLLGIASDWLRRKWSRVTWCPCEGGCARPRWTGKPLQIAVDSVAGTTEATRHARQVMRISEIKPVRGTKPLPVAASAAACAEYAHGRR